ncbi:MAG TPA: PGPGW domain-containing protein [Acidimicrobiia bacterium]|nr:PGPGW domain-containing protein [Acidimicrobiia bacterium]
MEAADPPEPEPSEPKPSEPEPSGDDATLAEQWIEAAAAAERATGEREEPLERAQAHIAIRLVRMGFGAALCVGGLAMLVLPGPGFVVLAIGLGVLARDVTWAERTLAVVRRRLPADASGKLPRSFMLTTVTVTVVALGISAWWTFR